MKQAAKYFMGTQVTKRNEYSAMTTGQLVKMFLSKWSGVRRNWMRENIFYFLACIPFIVSKRILSSSIHATPWASSSFSRVLLLLLPALICTSWESSACKYEWEAFGGSYDVDEKFTRPIYNLGGKGHNHWIELNIRSIDPIYCGDEKKEIVKIAVWQPVFMLINVSLHDNNHNCIAL